MTQPKAYGFVKNLQIQKKAIVDKRLSNGAFRVLAWLIAHANKNGKCWPSISGLAEAMGIKRQAISNQIRALKRAGYLRVDEVTGKTNIYTLLENSVPQSGSCFTRNEPISPPATQLDCAKRPLKKPLQETMGCLGSKFDFKVKAQQRDFYQEKKREADTGISKNDEQALEAKIQEAQQRMPLKERTALHLRLSAEAIRLYPGDKKKQHQYLIEEYTAAVENKQEQDDAMASDNS